MKKIYLLLFLLISVFSYSQETKYVVTISNLNYEMLKGVKNSSDDSKIRITVKFESGDPRDIYLKPIYNKGDREVNFNLEPFISLTKPTSIECFAFVNFRTGSDANKTITRSVNTS